MKKTNCTRLPIFQEKCLESRQYVLNNVLYYRKLKILVRELVAITNVPFQSVSSFFRKQNVQISPDFMIRDDLFLDFCSAFDYHLVSKKNYNLANLLTDYQVHYLPKFERCRQPVIIIMGHVNHGKTTLIDYIRKAHVAKHEDGKITQKFGFYEFEQNSKKMTFLDTPGHEAFVHLRSQGVKITDIIIIVIAVNDGVQNQTIEAIKLAQESKCRIIIVLNKIDLKNIDITPTIRQLAQHNILVNGRHKNTNMVKISAITGENIDQLLEVVGNEAQHLNLVMSESHYPIGVVIDSGFNKFRGVCATVFLIDGCLCPGDFLIFENEAYSVKYIEDFRQKLIPKAIGGQIIRLYNFKKPLQVGRKFIGVDTFKECKNIVQRIKAWKDNEQRQDVAKVKEDPTTWQRQFTDNSKIKKSEIKLFKIILIAENYGVTVAIEKMLSVLKSNEYAVEIIQKGVGAINKDNILRAHLAGAVIYSFNCGANKSALDLIKQYHVNVRYFNVIYLLVQDIEEFMLSQIDPYLQYVEVGRMVIKQIFNITKVGKISGCQVTEGYVQQTCHLKLLRKNELIHEGQISELKQFKLNVKRVVAPNECGVNITGFSKMMVGDEIIVLQKNS